MSQTAIYFSYDPITREFTGTGEAIPDAQNPGDFLIPAFSTFVPCGEIPAGMAAIFSEDEHSWFLTIDKRGLAIWHKETQAPVIISEFGEIPKGYTTKEPPKGNYYFNEQYDEWRIDEEKDRTAKINELRSRRNGLLNEVDIVYCNASNWSVMSEEMKAKWLKYKQELKDLTEKTDPYNPVFPVKPE